MTEITLTMANPGLAAHVLGVAAIKYEADKDTEAVALCNSLAAQIEAQSKPDVEEPKEFGSIVRAGYDKHTDRVLWVRTPGGWYSEESGGYHSYFKGLHDPEVLRVGIRSGGTEIVTMRILSRLRELRSEALTAERQNAYDCAIEAVEGLS